MNTKATTEDFFEDFGVNDQDFDGDNEVKKLEDPKADTEILEKIFIIGDIHGSIEAFRENLKSVGAIDENHDWIGGKSRLMILGDILCDRNPDGIKIMLELAKLRVQIEEVGGKLDVFCGNHDMELIDFLFHLHDPKKIGQLTFALLRDINQSARNNNGINQYYGMIEFLEILEELGIEKDKENEFIDNITGERNKDCFTIFNTLLKKHKEILAKISESNKYQKSIEEIKSMKLAERIGKKLIFHTDPTTEMIEVLQKYDFDTDELNNKFAALLDGTLPENEVDEVRDNFHTFCNTNNRRLSKSEGDEIGGSPNLNDEDYEILKSHGIEVVIHGHTDVERSYNIKNPLEVNDITIISVDNSFKKGTGENDDIPATLVLEGRKMTLYGKEIAA